MRFKNWQLFLWLMSCYCCSSSTVFAIDTIGLHITKIEQSLFLLKDIHFNLSKIETTPPIFIFKIKKLIFKKDSSLTLSHIKLACKKTIISHKIICKNGTFSANSKKYGKITANGMIIYDQKIEQLSFNLKKVQFSKLNGAIKGTYQKNSFNIHKLNVKGKVTDLLDLTSLPPKNIKLTDGTFDLSLKSFGTTHRLSKLNATLHLNQIAISETTTESEAAELDADLNLHLLNKKSRYFGQLDFKINKGMILTPFIYLEAEKKPIKLSTNFIFNQKSQVLQLNKGLFDLPHTLLAQFDAKINSLNKIIQQLNLNIKNIQLSTLFANNLQPVLTEPMLETLKIAGQADIMYQIVENKPDNIAIHIQNGEVLSLPTEDKIRFKFTGLNADLYIPQKKISSLSWHAGMYEKVAIGASSVKFRLDSHYFELVDHLTIPIFDGALLINELKIEKPKKDLKIKFDGVMKPISMRLLSQALDLPELSGSLGGIIPNITYEEGVLNVGGSILLRLFDGQIVISHLRLSGLLGYAPILETDVILKKINLEKLTKTFSFGRITGGLEGSIKGLVMENWQPTAFNAVLKTPKDDSYKHRISQRAVENISDLGGTGAAGALSRTFLSMFEDFIYSQLGFSCKLANGICQMNGVIPAKDGFYLVKGWGLPRIDIIGFNQRIEWAQFIQQLQAITTNGAPEIK